MKKIREWTTVEKIFKYESEEEMKTHEEIMIRSGYIIPPAPAFMERNLMVGYTKSECVDED